MNWKIGDLVYVRKGAIPIDGPFSREYGVPTHKQEPGVMFWSTPVIHGTAGMVISRRMVKGCRWLPDEPVYGVYLTNLQCREILEADLEKL